MGMPIILDPVEDESTARSFNQQELQTLAVAAAAAPSMHSTAAPPALPPRHPHRRPPRHQLHQSLHHRSSTGATTSVLHNYRPPTARTRQLCDARHQLKEEGHRYSASTTAVRRSHSLLQQQAKRQR
ncbi:hypothetical protein KVV02_007977 [Mortierella alpina]|uniref:Uncharacterized protein n=1 Tax=Mortierella alpina TaxID=64518 RepID=A0A9P8CVZ0_MORAP|nr:hypothetical protein KVV02_007977 [Mortierella alpina]